MHTNFIITADFPQPNRHTTVRTCCKGMGEPLFYVFYIATPES
jgi:hypothetical protein